MTGPRRPDRKTFSGTPAHRLIRGVLRTDIQIPYVARIELVRTSSWTISLVDTGNGDDRPWTSDGDTLFHVLWQQDEHDAVITAGNERFPISPGDTMSVPAGTPVHCSARMLMIRVEATARTITDILPPSHGTESFEGYNRRTDYPSPELFSLERWKITQPLTLAKPDTDQAIVAIASSLSILWRGGIDLVRQGECRIIDPSTGQVTLLPDGLGYALIARPAQPLA